MTINDILNSFTVEADTVIRYIDGETGEATDAWKSWKDNDIPFDIATEIPCYMTVVNGYEDLKNCPVLVIEY